MRCINLRLILTYLYLSLPIPWQGLFAHSTKCLSCSLLYVTLAVSSFICLYSPTYLFELDRCCVDLGLLRSKQLGLSGRTVTLLSLSLGPI